VVEIQARYLVGCDGGRSTVRNLAGISLYVNILTSPLDKGLEQANLLNTPAGERLGFPHGLTDKERSSFLAVFLGQSTIGG
jgi:2-polyprenyl-6-methoxyphenol hydroxylase-like FAD-dependent oxidoreductase